MKEQDKKALIEKMTQEREELIKETTITQYLMDLLSKKARDVVDQNKKEGKRLSVLGSNLLNITCFKYNESLHVVIIDSQEKRIIKEEFQEMIDTISLIKESGYEVKEIKANKEEGTKEFGGLLYKFLKGYQIMM